MSDVEDLQVSEIISNSKDVSTTIVNPLLLNIIPSSAKLQEYYFVIEISAQALWEWKNLSKTTLFLSLNDSLQALGYRLLSTSLRLQNQLKVVLDRLLKRVKRMNTKARKTHLGSEWFSVSVHGDEMVAVPSEILEEKKAQIDNLEKEKTELNNALEEKSKCVLKLLSHALENEKNISDLMKAANVSTNTGKPIDQVQPRQQRRKLNEVRDQSNAVLWFARTYGLIPKSLVVEERETGKKHTLNIDNEASEVPSNEQSVNETTPKASTSLHQTPENMTTNSTRHYKTKKYEQLSDEEKEAVKNLTFLLDKFGVSLQAYHEITQLPGHENLPRSYRIEGCQSFYDSQLQIKKTPGPYEGAELDFRHLLTEALCDHIKNMNTQEPEKNTYRVKISSDGTVVSRNSNLVVFSFSLLDQGSTVMSSTGNHTIAIIKTQENYQSLREALHNVVSAVNSLNKDKFIEVDGKKLRLEFYLGGDYKFILLCLGMKQATCNHACIYCKVHKDERQDLTKTCEYFKSEEMKRKLHESWSKDPGCQQQYLFDIPLDHIIVDELHMLLRIMDRLEHALIYEAIDWDQVQTFTCSVEFTCLIQRSQEDNAGLPNKNVCQGLHLNTLIRVIRSCGVSFAVWINKDNNIEWTSLMGGDKKKLLKNLPLKLAHCVHPSKLRDVRKLWQDFSDIYDVITSLNPDPSEIQNFRHSVLNWAKHLMSIKGEGFNWTYPITPYIHILVYHLPDVLARMGAIKVFTGQGVEKKNDDIRKAFHRSINRWDACKSCLVVDKRKESLACMQREKRPYVKRKLSYWSEGGKKEVFKKIPRLSVPDIAENDLITFTESCVPENILEINGQAVHSQEDIGQAAASNMSEMYSFENLNKKPTALLRSILFNLTGKPVKKLKKSLLIDHILSRQS